jgi:DNA-directed RNA polymerase subunit RPC12/RpoP
MMARQSRLQIEHQCPQCGAPIVLEETDHLFACQYCKVRSFLFPGDFFRYMLPHSAPQGKPLVYLPYWRFKGILFSSLLDRIDHRIVDVSHQALVSDYFPVSLGLRSQALKLRFVSPETEGYFLKPSVPHKEMMQLIAKRFSTSLPQPIFEQCFIGETLSQIYSPFYVDGKIYDAVLNRPIPSSPSDDFDVMTLPGGAPNWQIRFIPAQCPDCGWDLEGERDSIVLSCKNCSSLWICAKKGFRKLEFGHVPEESGPVLYLPFYRISADIKGIDLHSYADLVRVANLPKIVQEEMEKRPFNFWSPAFKIRPRDFLRFSIIFTLSQPEESWIPGLPKTEIYPVTLSILEALESLKINLACFMKPPGLLLPTLADIQVKPKNLVLVYFPFQVQRDEIYHPLFQLRTTRTVLNYARNL